MQPRSASLPPRLVLAALALAAASSLLASPCAASGTPPSSTTPTSQETPSTPSLQPPSEPDSAAEAAALHARVIQQYRKGFNLTLEAKADLQAGKTKDAKKKFEKALKIFDEVTRLDPKHYESWNMVGFTSRKTGDLKRAFAAYDKALALKPDYEEAHEYLGEAYIMSGDMAKAKEQLAWLKNVGGEEAAELEASIHAAEQGKTAGHGSGW
ncbi:MAG TPA: tetratricopeptide repeat protein [Candidatus Limnocylindrales bacterium]|nr:tetratricopeptide repeat protein [Candidatus Limnocylindrales bacterium]